MSPEAKVIEYLLREPSETERLALWLREGRWEIVSLYYDEFHGDIVFKAPSILELAIKIEQDEE